MHYVHRTSGRSDNRNGGVLRNACIYPNWTDENQALICCPTTDTLLITILHLRQVGDKGTRDKIGILSPVPLSQLSHYLDAFC